MPFATLSPCYHNLVNRLLIYSSYGQVFFLFIYEKSETPVFKPFTCLAWELSQDRARTDTAPS